MVAYLCTSKFQGQLESRLHSSHLVLFFLRKNARTIGQVYRDHGVQVGTRDVAIVGTKESIDPSNLRMSGIYNVAELLHNSSGGSLWVHLGEINATFTKNWRGPSPAVSERAPSRHCH